MTNLWVWDRRAATWFYGNENHGCGVFEDFEANFDGERMRWTGNVSAYGQVICVGWKDSIEEAMKACLAQLEIMNISHNYEGAT